MKSVAYDSRTSEKMHSEQVSAHALCAHEMHRFPVLTSGVKCVDSALSEA